MEVSHPVNGAVIQLTEVSQGWKKVFWCTKVYAPHSKFRRTLCTSKFCTPCNFSRFTCSHHCIPCCAPNEVSYEKMKQYNKILQFPHIWAKRLSKKKKPRLCFTQWAIYHLAVMVIEWAVVDNAANLLKIS